MDEKRSEQEREHAQGSEEGSVVEEGKHEPTPEENKMDWGYDKGERIFKLKNLRFKPFTTAVTELEKYGDAVRLTGNLYVRQFVDRLSEGIWKMRYYEKPFTEYCVQAQFLEGVTWIEMTDVDVDYDLIYHISGKEGIFGHIKLLRFRNCNIKEEQLKILGPRLRFAYVLSDLDLSHNPIGDEGLIVLVKYLQQCASLRTLNLFDTQITPFGLEKFAQLYSKQQVLIKKLNIGRNRLNSQSIVRKFLGGIVKRSAPLEELLMANCMLQGAETASSFETTLLSSDCLRYIDISFNFFNTEEELLSIITLFAKSSSIKEMVLNFNPISDSALTSMLDCLFEYPNFEPQKHLYLENITMPQVYFKKKWNSFNRNDLKITMAGVRKIKIPQIDSYKYKLVKRFNYLYKKKKPKKDMVISILQENLPPKTLKRVKADDFKDALMMIGKIDFTLIQDIVTEFAGGTTRANVKEFMDIYSELFPYKPKPPKKSAAEKKPKKEKKRKSVTAKKQNAPAVPSGNAPTK